MQRSTLRRAPTQTINLIDGLAIAAGDLVRGGGGYVPDPGGLTGQCTERGGDIALFNNVVGQIQRTP